MVKQALKLQAVQAVSDSLMNDCKTHYITTNNGYERHPTTQNNEQQMATNQCGFFELGEVQDFVGKVSYAVFEHLTTAGNDAWKRSRQGGKDFQPEKLVGDFDDVKKK